MIVASCTDAVCIRVHRVYWAQTTVASPLLFTGTSLDHTYKRSRLKVMLTMTIVTVIIFSFCCVCPTYFQIFSKFDWVLTVLFGAVVSDQILSPS